MVQFHAEHVDASFAALSDATRRGVLERLAREDASITQLADTFQMTLTGIKKHVSVLEHAGLVVAVVPGERANFKLTTAEDFAMAEALLAARSIAPASSSSWRARRYNISPVGVSFALRPWISNALTPSVDSSFCTA